MQYGVYILLWQAQGQYWVEIRLSRLVHGFDHCLWHHGSNQCAWPCHEDMQDAVLAAVSFLQDKLEAEICYWFDLWTVSTTFILP